MTDSSMTLNVMQTTNLKVTPMTTPCATTGRFEFQRGEHPGFNPRAKFNFFLPALVLIAVSLLSSMGRAQTINFTALPPALVSNLFVGANFSGSYTNLQFKSTLSTPLDPSNPVTYIASGAPSGVTITFSGTGTTNTVVNTITVGVTNVATGVYPITITAMTNGVQFGTASSTFNLVAGNLWTNLSTTAVSWSTVANWSGGLPGAGQDVLFQDVGALNPATNYVDTSFTIGSLSFIRNQSGTTNSLILANGVALAVSGTNGFSLNEDGINSPVSNKGMTVRIAGGPGSIFVVTNQNANYAVNGDSTGAIGASSGTILTMTNLDNQFVNVNRIGLGDATLMDRGAVAAEMVFVELAKTNVFISGYSNVFWGIEFTNSIQCFNQYDNGNSGYSSGNPMNINLGISNAFLADSMRVAGNACQGLSIFKFNPVFTNGIVPTALFRSTNGGRMSFLGIAVQSGSSTGSRFTRGSLLFNQGLLDMQVDTIWLGANRTNDSSSGSSGNASTGTLTFGGTLNPTPLSVVDVNKLIAGNQVFTNNVFCNGNINVQTNALLIVNNYLELGHTTGDTNIGAIGTAAARGLGNLTINGGTARINQINVGDLSTNNQINLGIGGHLIVSNTIASAAKSLTTLNVNGAKITFNVTSGVTNAFVTNLVTGASATVVNLASLTGFSPTVPATNVIIAYQDSFSSHNLSIGSLPAGFNNITLVDNTASKTIELRIATNAPATLRWIGGENSNWNHTSLNWQNTNTLATTRFFDGDKVIFGDTTGVPTTILVTDVITPGQVGTGIWISNSVNSYTFNGGGGSIGNCSLVKTGVNNVAINLPTSLTAQIDSGKVTGSGTLGGTTVSATGAIDFSGTINGPLQVGGKATIASGGVVANTLQVQSGGVLTNNGTIQGNSLTLDSGSLLYNSASGLLSKIGNANAVNVAINATLINVGNIGSEGQANSLTVNGTFKDMGLGTIYLTTMTLNGGSTFLPGGDGIGTTAILSATVGSSFPGRLTLLAGSTTWIKVDFANPQTNTIVKSQYTDFGGNTAVVSYDGATILVTNINTGAGSLASGQSFRMFQNSDTGIGSGNIGNEGLNTTNRYPIIQPVIPAVNTKWDLTNLRMTDPNGFVNVISYPTTGTNITFSLFKDGTNVVTHLQWPTEYIGWSLQQQTNSLTVGLSTNWTLVSGSTTSNDLYITNDAAIDTTFYRMVYP
jgi:hypothetical protein